MSAASICHHGNRNSREEPTVTSPTTILGAAAIALALAATQAPGEPLKIASPQRGSWEGAVPELGQQQGIFKRHGLELDILFTAGGGETLQAGSSGAGGIAFDAGARGGSAALPKRPARAA